jgi:hypothetical protein
MEAQLWRRLWKTTCMHAPVGDSLVDESSLQLSSFYVITLSLIAAENFMGMMLKQQDHLSTNEDGLTVKGREKW